MCALLKHTDNQDERPVVAVDGSVFEKFPNFSQLVKDGVKDVLGEDKIDFVLSKEGSGFGAAIASMI